MQESRRFCSEPWRYTMTAQETQTWRDGDRPQREHLLEALGVRVLGEAADHHRNRFVIADVDGEIIAEGEIRAPNIEIELEIYRRQISLN